MPAQPQSVDADPTTASATDGKVPASWLTTTSHDAAIPIRALQGYAAAAVAESKTSPTCGITWNTIAAIGEVESANGTHGGAHIAADGRLVGSILGPVLDGTQFAAVPDTDRGVLDGDKKWDRAVGPLQFLPATWAAYGTDASGDGVADPNQIDDAALSAAKYLCAIGGDLTTDAGWTAAIHAYNASDEYVKEVATQANQYAGAVG
jgi:membrane-bound lytic murein transglycosylase B